LDNTDHIDYYTDVVVGHSYYIGFVVVVGVEDDDENKERARMKKVPPDHHLKKDVDPKRWMMMLMVMRRGRMKKRDDKLDTDYLKYHLDTYLEPHDHHTVVVVAAVEMDVVEVWKKMMELEVVALNCKMMECWMEAAERKTHFVVEVLEEMKGKHVFEEGLKIYNLVHLMDSVVVVAAAAVVAFVIHKVTAAGAVVVVVHPILEIVGDTLILGFVVVVVDTLQIVVETVEVEV
jgi:hypothetical protein